MRNASAVTFPHICTDSAEWVEAHKALQSAHQKKEQREKLIFGVWKHGRYRIYTQQGLCSRRRGHAGRNSPREDRGKTVHSVLIFVCVSVVTPFSSALSCEQNSPHQSVAP